MQEKFEYRLQYGFHKVFILAALLDPKLYATVNSICMEERIQAEELVLSFFPSRAFGNAAVAQLKAWREGKHGIPEHAFTNPALIADAVGFWRDYGSENPALKYIAKVAVRVLGIPPTAAGMLQTSVFENLCEQKLRDTCRASIPTAETLSYAMQEVSAIGLHLGACGVTTETACSLAEWPCSSIATTTRGCWTVHTRAGLLWTGILSWLLWSWRTLSGLPKGMLLLECQVQLLNITLSALASHQPCLMPESDSSAHAGVEPMSDEEEEVEVMQDPDVDDEQENVSPSTAAAVAAEEAMMERDAAGPYRVVL